MRYEARFGSDHVAEPLEPILALPVESLAESLLKRDWNFQGADTAHDGHGLLPYPAKFPPQVPEQVIRLLSEPGDLVLDAFGGSGTSAAEAVRLGRDAYSIDANPVATSLTEIKTAKYDARTRQAVRRFVEVLRGADVHELIRTGSDSWKPEIPNLHRWYSQPIVDELAGVRALISSTFKNRAGKRVCLTVFSHVASRLSFQDSETRYKSVPRVIPAGEACVRLADELLRVDRVLCQRSPILGMCRAVTGDARDLDVYPEPGSVGLFVTSPPYPNAYDYHLYHRFRLFWLGADPTELRRLEVGSHLTNQARRNPIHRYEVDTSAYLANAFTTLRPGRFAVVVVGDGLHEGKTYDTAEGVARLGKLIGFEPVVEIRRCLPTLRRSVTIAGRRLVSESIVIFRKPDRADQLRDDPTYELFPYEEVLAAQELHTLSSGDGRSLKTPKQAAFSSRVSIDNIVVPTWQSIAEYVADGSMKKNSTYAGHGIHRYKGKFYPQLAKALINVADPYTKPGVVLDPFGGCGTVGIESRLAGVDAVSMDVNPLAVALTRAKSALLDLRVETLEEAIWRVIGCARRTPSVVDWSQFSPSVREELESWFPKPVLAKLSQLLLGIDRSASESKTRELVSLVLRAVASDLIREVSHQEPTDLRIRRRPTPLSDGPVFERFEEKVLTLLQRRQRFEHRLRMGPKLGHLTVIEGSAADCEPYEAAIDPRGGIAAVISSPPYGVALPYLDTDRLSLAAIYGIDKSARRSLERELIGSREITGRDQASWESVLFRDGSSNLPTRTVAFVESLYRAISEDHGAGFRRRQMPSLLLRYFISMSKVLNQVAKRLVNGAEVCLVLGDSRTTVCGQYWTIPTVDEVVAIAKELGLTLVDDLPITVTREALLNARNSITNNRVIRLSL